jgi:signal recognition particle GTPase
MNQDQAINRLAQISGKSRKDVIETLKRMSAMPEVQKELKKSRK